MDPKYGNSLERLTSFRRSLPRIDLDSLGLLMMMVVLFAGASPAMAQCGGIDCSPLDTDCAMFSCDPGAGSENCDIVTPRPAGTVCRAGSGDLCDLAESCTGTPGAACPAEVAVELPDTWHAYACSIYNSCWTWSVRSTALSV